MKYEHWQELQEMAMDSPIIHHWVSMMAARHIDSDDDMLMGIIEGLQNALDHSLAAHAELLAKRPVQHKDSHLR